MRGKKGIGAFAACAFFALVALAAPETAWAFFDAPPAGDRSMTLLNSIFGNVISGDGSDGGPLGGVVGVFNGAVLLFGGILAAYTLLAGTMSTAHDGEMLGKKWSSMWVPIRTAVGTALCIPLGGGYCAAQLFAGWMVVQSVGLANTGWKTFVDSYATMDNMSAIISEPDIRSLANTMLRSNVCMATYNKIRGSSEDAKYMMDKEMAASSSDPEALLIYGTRAANGETDRNCGGVVLPKYDGSRSSASSTAISNAAGLGLGIDLSTTNFEQASVQAHSTAAKAMDAKLKALAQKIVDSADGGAIPAGSEFDVIVKEYKTSVVNEFKSATAGQMDSAFASVRSAATTDGWFMAGAFFMRLSALQDSISMMAHSGKPSAVDPKPFSVDGSEKYATAYSNFLSKASMSRTSSQLNGTGMEIKESLLDKAGNFVKAAYTAVSDPTEYFDMKLKAYAREHVKEKFEWLKGEASGRHPIIFAKDVGNFLIDSSVAGILIGAAINAASVGGAMTVATAGFVMALVMPLGAFGATLAFYIPMAPFVVFLAAGIAWMIFVIEAMFAMPLWAVMHLHPDGHEWSGRSGSGYMLLVTLLLQPVLMVMGLATAIVVCIPVFNLVNAVFFDVMLAAVSPSLSGIIAALAGFAIYAYLQITLMHKMFGLVHHVPEHVLRWVGGQGSGGMAHAADSMSQQAGSAGAAAAGGLAGGALGGAASNAVQTHRSVSQNQAHLASQAREAKLASDTKNESVRANADKASLDADAAIGKAERPNATQGDKDAAQRAAGIAAGAVGRAKATHPEGSDEWNRLEKDQKRYQDIADNGVGGAGFNPRAHEVYGPAAFDSNAANANVGGTREGAAGASAGSALAGAVAGSTGGQDGSQSSTATTRTASGGQDSVQPKQEHSKQEERLAESLKDDKGKM